MSIYNSVDYSNNYSRTAAHLITDDVDNITNFTGGSDSNSFKFKQKVTSQRGHYGTGNVKLMVPVKHLSNFWRNFEMSLSNCEINVILTRSENCVKESHTPVNQAITFAITYTILYVPVVTLSTDDNAKLMQQLKSGFKRTINWNRYQ